MGVGMAVQQLLRSERRCSKRTSSELPTSRPFLSFADYSQEITKWNPCSYQIFVQGLSNQIHRERRIPENLRKRPFWEIPLWAIISRVLFV
ncbi:hypothetical protein DL98DRAFT_215145 [Cadophora sp. DSE1049]|nr:hypothetical protein DL98DRAFT_215145 [Cadophora sp. DSE1049]